MNPNHGHYLEVVRDKHDGCHWNPDEQRGSLVQDRHFRSSRAVVVVGHHDASVGIQYRLCAACAQLPRWNRGHRHAAAYADIRDRRMALTTEEHELKTTALTLMHKYGKTIYRRNGIEIRIVESDEDVKVTVKKAGDEEPAAEDVAIQ